MMKKKLQIIAYTLAVYLTFTVSAHAQCVETANDPCISVHQSVIDRTAKALTELQASRETIAAFLSERKATEAERAAYQNVIKATDAAIDAYKKGIEDREKIITLWEKAFNSAMALADHYLKELSKPKSGWQKFLTALKEVALIATGVIIGHGL